MKNKLHKYKPRRKQGYQYQQRKKQRHKNTFARIEINI